ncbi:hypothetical protein O1611_g90 [Lasiodiplodia mahajangana]|uniref:Uncharacterized protein n=1 Tax=Lasiodiplodia mahajangana TaxID=1108764 RepID=A0ACC2K1T9_9PEZI|nr:hypothetical protein O1611_g90 [Lasiodiplodia mahajangana]
MASGFTYLITGANRGIGQGLVATFLQEPSTTVIAAVRDVFTESAKALEFLPRAEGSRLIIIKIDSAVENDAAEAADALVSKHGVSSLDVVIANAGISHSGTSIAKTPASTLLEHISINVVAPIQLFQATAPLLRASQSGRPTFVALTSVVGSIGGMELLKELPPALSPYGGSKAALNWFIRRLHFEETWLTSFVIHPGLVLTDMAEQTFGAAGVDPRTIGGIEIEESVQGIASRIRSATKDISGTFQTYDGQVLPW